MSQKCYTLHMLEAFRQELKKAGQSYTRPREELFMYLQQAGPSHPSQIVQDLSGKLDRASVYRTLNLFSRLGIIHEVGTGARRRYELSDRYDAHHHHFRCEGCGETLALHEPGIERSIERAMKNRGWKLRLHQIELTGRCDKCLRRDGEPA